MSLIGAIETIRLKSTSQSREDLDKLKPRKSPASSQDAKIETGNGSGSGPGQSGKTARQKWKINLVSAVATVGTPSKKKVTPPHKSVIF